MMYRKGVSPLRKILTAILLTTVCIGDVSGFDSGIIFPLFKLYVKKMRTFVDSYHPEIEFAKCAVSTFPLYELFPELLREFHPDYIDEPEQTISSRSINDSDISNIIPLVEKTTNDITSSVQFPLPSPQDSIINNPFQYSPSMNSPPLSNQYSSPESKSTSSIPPPIFTTPLPLLATYSPLPSLNHQQNALLNPQTAYPAVPTSLSSPSIPLGSSNPPITNISTPTSPLPSYFLYQTMKATGISAEDSMFVIELLELLFPDIFTSSVAEFIAAFQGGEQQKVRQNDNINIADAWLEGLDAVLASIFGAHPHAKREPLRNLVPAFRWEPLVPPKTYIPISRVGEEYDEEGENDVTTDWWTSVLSRVARFYHRLRIWLLPDANQGKLGGAEAKLVGLAHCSRGYLVDIIWRWGEEEAEELRKEIEAKQRENHVFRPETSPMQILPPLLKLLMPS